MQIRLWSCTVRTNDTEIDLIFHKTECCMERISQFPNKLRDKTGYFTCTASAPTVGLRTCAVWRAVGTLLRSFCIVTTLLFPETTTLSFPICMTLIPSDRNFSDSERLEPFQV